jgi:dipeptidase D
LYALAATYNLEIKNEVGYPSWKPIFDSKLLTQVKEIYKNNFGQEAKVKAIHAGLECGILKDRMGELDAISFGPNIFDAHSPDERVEIASVGRFWDYLKAILREL